MSSPPAPTPSLTRTGSRHYLHWEAPWRRLRVTETEPSTIGVEEEGVARSRTTCRCARRRTHNPDASCCCRGQISRVPAETGRKMNWGFLENVLSGVNRYSTAVGRVWLSVLFLFRILVYVAAAEQVWKDEQRDFVCNTRQPGCENACFDHLFPISQVRLWALQLIAVSTPSLLVALHVAYREHREAKHKRKLYEDKGSIDGGLFCTYVVSLVFKTTFEVGSLLAFYFLYNGFDVPILHRCSQSPCPNVVDCYIAKAKEKKIFLYIMGCTSILCIALNFVELLYIVWKQLWRRFTRRYVPREQKVFSYNRTSASKVTAEPGAEAGQQPVPPPNAAVD